MDVTDRIQSWLKSDIPTRTNYHNHKETMAWTAVAFYSPAIIILAYTAGPLLGTYIKIVLTIGITLLGMATLMFVNMQFEMRWISNDVIVALQRSIVSLVTRKDKQPELDFNLPPIDDKAFPTWPKFVQEEIDRCKTNRSVKLFGPAIRKFFCFQWQRIDARLRTELASYIVIIVATVISLTCLWVFEKNPLSTKDEAKQPVSSVEQLQIKPDTRNREPNCLQIIGDANNALQLT